MFATTRGRLYLVDLADGRVVRETALATSNMVRDLDIAGGHLLALVDGGGAQVLSLEGLAMVTPLPVTEGAWAGLLEGGRIATFGDGLTVRVLDDGPVAALDGFIGVTSATLDFTPRCASIAAAPSISAARHMPGESLRRTTASSTARVHSSSGYWA